MNGDVYTSEVFIDVSWFFIMGRLAYIDRLKGFLMLMVIIGHIPSHTLHPYYSFSPFLKIIMLFHMPAFFFASGYVAQSRPSKNKCTEKLFRYLCPLIIIGLLSEYLLYEKSMCHFLSSSTWNSYWYLYCIAIFTIMLFPVKFSFNNVKTKGILIDVLLMVFVISFMVVLYKILSWQVNQIFSIYLLLAYFPFFWLGFIVRKHKEIEKIIDNMWLCVVFFVLSVIFGVLFYERLNIIYHGLSGVFITFVLLKLFKLCESRGSVIEKQLALFGRNSLDIYLYQFFLLKLIDVSLVGKWSNSSHNYIVEFIIMLLMAILISYICIGIGLLLKKSSLIRKIVYGDVLRV